jgi:galactokinase
MNQGHFATVKRHPTDFIFHICSQRDIRTIHMDESSLLKEATSNTLYSYVAGVAYQMHKKYLVKGLEIHNTASTIPLKSGLGASGAICVLVAKAFNQAYNLHLSPKEEMEIAYLGEITAQSSCGRMDQACAFGNRPILMSFDGDNVDIQELDVGKDLFFVIVESGGTNDTKEILASLRECYPKAENSLQEAVQRYLGPINKEIVSQAAQAIKEGNAEKIGTLMRHAQAQFDLNLIPACPEQLAGPKLHAILNYPPIQQYIYGGKGTGAQGNVCVQFIAKDAKSQKKIIEIIENTLSIPCLPLTIPAERCSDK